MHANVAVPETGFVATSIRPPESVMSPEWENGYCIFSVPPTERDPQLSTTSLFNNSSEPAATVSTAGSNVNPAGNCTVPLLSVNESGRHSVNPGMVSAQLPATVVVG